MKSQYESQVNSGLSTLYEKFPKGGSYNHAWNGSNTILSKYVAGIKPVEVAWNSFEVCPNLVHMTSLSTKVPTVKGDIKLEINKNEKSFTLRLISPAHTTAIICIPKQGKQISEVMVNGTMVWKKGRYISDVKRLKFVDSNNAYIRFKVGDGEWMFEAVID
jgi:hypothetical protein